MDRQEDKRAFFTRRRLIILVVTLTVVQVGILAYIGTLLWTDQPQRRAGVTPTSPSASAGVSEMDGGGESAEGSGTTAVTVGSLVPADSYVQLARGFDAERALEHIAYLASDELGGRQPGTPGGRAAGEYIAARFAEYGLEPGGVDRTYYQTFTVPYGRITEPPVLEVMASDGEVITDAYDYRDDYRILTGGYLGAGEGEGPVVWLNDCTHDQFVGQDLVDKIVFCDRTYDPNVYREAIEHQVGGLLLLDRAYEEGAFRRGGYRETSWVPETIPTYLISPSVGEDLLVGTRYSLDDLSLRFSATPLSTTVYMAVSLEEQEQVEARNVLAYLPGSDPERADEVVVIGAHYDHLGLEPDGAVMNGANDNASGVAVVLETARLWQTRGFEPARSVLFAAWDGEEQGLLGSSYYVENATYPITQTVAMLNLDMVGAGETLRIDGEGTVAAQFGASAETYGITYTHSAIGRSDHSSFNQVGVPAAMYIWWPDPFYHTPDDELGIIEPDKLRAVGVASAHALTAVSDGHVQLEQAVERLEATIATGDREAFLESLDPTDPDLQAAQAGWFDNLWSQELALVEVEPVRMQVRDGEAEMTLRLSYGWADGREEPSVSYDGRFAARDGAWYFAGYGLDTRTDGAVTVARFNDVPVGANELLTATRASYLRVTSDLGMEPITGTRFIYYPNSAAMRAIARPAAERDTRWLVPSARRAEIAWGEPITPAVVSLALNQMGLPSDAAPWLREGLALRYQDVGETEHLPALASSDVVTPLVEWGASSDLPPEEGRGLRAHAWSAAAYLLDQYGAEGLAALCEAWDETGDAEAAFEQGLGLSPEQFESAWRAEWVDPLRADVAGIEATLDARAQAVLGGDEAAFLDTVTLSDSVLRTEQAHWFADLARHPAVTYTLTGEVVAWSPGAEGVQVDLTAHSVISGDRSSRVTYRARFVEEDGGWRYAGVAWPNQLSSEHFVIKYHDRDPAWARRVLNLAEEAYAQVTADLGSAPPLPQEIKVYQDQEVFRASILLSLPPCTGWTEPGESIKLWLGDGDRDFAVQRVLAHELTHQILFAQGLEAAWLHEGVAEYESGRVIPLGHHWMSGKHTPAVLEAVRRQDDLLMDELPITLEEFLAVDPELAYAQPWSMVSFIVERYGEDALSRLIDRSIASDDTAANVRSVLGVEAETFREGWREYVYAGGGVPQEAVALARRFDAERALDHIEFLASPELGGREAGTPGADQAASYIAEQFADLGLEPLGDPLTITETGELGYLQHFPISHTEIITVPALTLLGDDGDVVLELSYREDFLDSGGSGSVEEELVWVRADNLEELHFDGAVVLERDVEDPLERARQLEERGAGGLVVVTDLDMEALQTQHVQSTDQVSTTIPVFEITPLAFETLMGALDMETGDFSASPPALPLGVRARQSLVRSPVTTTLTANVLGLLPGEDPELGDEVIVVGANYDHIGRAPDGLYHPGANHNASGVAALLEMARLWREQGYRPDRSVLLAAWGAEELGSLGVEHYLSQPAAPLTRTVAVVSVDGIAAGGGYQMLYFGRREDDQPLIQPVEASGDQLGRRVWRRGSTGEGWHTLFSREGIPTTKFIWDQAEEDFYLPSDAVSGIDLEKLASSGEVLTLTTAWLARR